MNYAGLKSVRHYISIILTYIVVGVGVMPHQSIARARAHGIYEPNVHCSGYHTYTKVGVSRGTKHISIFYPTVTINAILSTGYSTGINVSKTLCLNLRSDYGDAVMDYTIPVEDVGGKNICVRYWKRRYCYVAAYGDINSRSCSNVFNFKLHINQLAIINDAKTANHYRQICPKLSCGGALSNINAILSCFGCDYSCVSGSSSQNNCPHQPSYTERRDYRLRQSNVDLPPAYANLMPRGVFSGPRNAGFVVFLTLVGGGVLVGVGLCCDRACDAQKRINKFYLIITAISGLFVALTLWNWAMFGYWYSFWSLGWQIIGG